MLKHEKRLLIGAVAAVSLVTLFGFAERNKPHDVQLAQPEHACSEQVDAMLTMRHDGERYRQALCDEGEEAKLDQMAKDADDARRHGRKAF